MSLAFPDELLNPKVLRREDTQGSGGSHTGVSHSFSTRKQFPIDSDVSNLAARGR